MFLFHRTLASNRHGVTPRLELSRPFSLLSQAMPNNSTHIHVDSAVFAYITIPLSALGTVSNLLTLLAILTGPLRRNHVLLLIVSLP